jgi:hypothetical protein
VRIGGSGINAGARRSDDTEADWAEVASVDPTDARNSSPPQRWVERGS